MEWRPGKGMTAEDGREDLEGLQQGLDRLLLGIPPPSLYPSLPCPSESADLQGGTKAILSFPGFQLSTGLLGHLFQHLAP